MKHFSALAFLLISVLLYSCSATTPPTDDGPGLQGQVSLEDSTGTPIPPPYSGITVSFSGTNITTNTDALGNWSVPKPPQGNYYIVFSKDGFGSISFNESYIITYNSWTAWQPGSLVLTQAPDSIVRVEKVYVFDSASLWPQTLAIFVTAKSSRVFYFIDSTPNVPSTGVHASYPTEIFQNSANRWYGDMDRLGTLGFHHGQTAYVTACAGSAATRWREVNNQAALSNVGPSSNAIPIIIP